MRKLQILEEKIRTLSEQVIKLRTENQKLKTEVRFFQSELERQKKHKFENEVFENQKALIKDKLTKLLNKFNQLGI